MPFFKNVSVVAYDNNLKAGDAKTDGCQLLGRSEILFQATAL